MKHCDVRARRSSLVLLLTFCAAGSPVWGQAAVDDAASLTVPADVPLRIEVTRTVNLKTGQPFHGKLVEPVYGPDRLLLPMGSEVDGVVAATPAADRATRVNAKLDGDFTPLREPVVRVTQLRLPSGVVLPVAAEGGMRNAATILLATQPSHTTIVGRVKSMVHDQLKQVRNTLHDPHKGDRLKQLLFHQLPYHPQRVWAGSAFDAVLTQPLLLPATAAAAQLPRAAAIELTSGMMHARLTSGISSASSKKGDAVTAVLTAPFCNQQGQVMLPAGTPLNGLVMQAQPARSFGRGGRLRFSFRSMTPPRRQATQRIDGSLASVQGLDNQNIALDDEGGAVARPDQGRFVVPLVLVALVAASQGDDEGGIARQGVTSNGFGLPARILSMTLASRNLSTAFASYGAAKSIYRRFLTRGHEVTFPKHTELGIGLGRR